MTRDPVSHIWRPALSLLCATGAKLGRQCLPVHLSLWYGARWGISCKHMETYPSLEGSCGWKWRWDKRYLNGGKASSNPMDTHKGSSAALCRHSLHLTVLTLLLSPCFSGAAALPWITRLFQRLEDFLETESYGFYWREEEKKKKKQKVNFYASSLPLVRSLCMGDGGGGTLLWRKQISVCLSSLWDCKCLYINRGHKLQWLLQMMKNISAVSFSSCLLTIWEFKGQSHQEVPRGFLKMLLFAFRYASVLLTAGCITDLRYQQLWSWEHPREGMQQIQFPQHSSLFERREEVLVEAVDWPVEINSEGWDLCLRRPNEQQD